MAPEKLLEVMESISIENMTKGEHELQYVSHGRHELVLHFTHNEDFEVNALQEAFEEKRQFVEYTYVDDPDEKDSFCSE